MLLKYRYTTLQINQLRYISNYYALYSFCIQCLHNNESRIIFVTLRLFECTNMIICDTLCGTFSLSFEKTITHCPQNAFGKWCCLQANLGTATKFSSITKPASFDWIPLILMALELASRTAKDLATASFRSSGAVFKPPRDRIDVQLALEGSSLITKNLLPQL